LTFPVSQSFPELPGKLNQFDFMSFPVSHHPLRVGNWEAQNRAKNNDFSKIQLPGILRCNYEF